MLKQGFLYYLKLVMWIMLGVIGADWLFFDHMTGGR